MSTFSLRDWLFSFKTFAAAILALYIGFWLDLSRPYWAMTTVYICSQSLSGTTRSKAFFRVCEYSVQRNHIHLIVEAVSKRDLSRGM